MTNQINEDNEDLLKLRAALAEAENSEAMYINPDEIRQEVKNKLRKAGLLK